MSVEGRSTWHLFRHAAGVFLLLALGFGTQPGVGAEGGALKSLSPNLLVFRGPINVGIVRDGPKALLIDVGDGSVQPALAAARITTVDRVLFTHHHRDQACGLHRLFGPGTQVGVPAAERDYFERVADYWNNPQSRWHIYNFHPHHLMLAEPVRVDFVLKPDEELAWGPARIRALATPGHTGGSLSYLVEVDGRKTVFCGDVLYDEGRVWDIHSLQKGFRRGKRSITDYHGFLGSRPELIDSLRKIRETGAGTLIPSHGRMMSDPEKAIDTLVGRLDACYDQYVAISALRHYFPELFAEYAGRADHMAIGPMSPPPEFLRHFGTTWVVLSQDKHAFVMDCGNSKVIAQLKELMDKGEIASVEGLWVTHYHDDHVDAIPEFQKAFDCSCYADRSVAGVITRPRDWRLPCISPSVARVDHPTADEESWKWREFKMTAYHLPGQTLYHGGLLVEGRGARMLFVGDSFTPAGIDDYCSHNRVWLGKGVGFDRCIGLIEKLRPTHIFNCHVAGAFTFSAEQCRFMRDNLAERVHLFGKLTAWDHPNYATDESWCRCSPYEQTARPGDIVTVRVVTTNHSSEDRALASRLLPPQAWKAAEDGAASQPSDRQPAPAGLMDWGETTVPAGTDGQVSLEIQLPANAAAGRYVIPADVRYGDRFLPQFTEAIVVIEPPSPR